MRTDRCTFGSIWLHPPGLSIDTQPWRLLLLLLPLLPLLLPLLLLLQLLLLMLSMQAPALFLERRTMEKPRKLVE